MNIQIKIKGGAGAGFTLTDSMRDYVNKRCETFARFLEADPSAFVVVELGKTSERQKHGDIFSAEIHVVGKIAGKTDDLYAGAEREDLYAAIDAVRDEIFRGISSKKSKSMTMMRRSGARVKNILKGFMRRGGGDVADEAADDGEGRQ